MTDDLITALDACGYVAHAYRPNNLERSACYAVGVNNDADARRLINDIEGWCIANNRLSFTGPKIDLLGLGIIVSWPQYPIAQAAESDPDRRYYEREYLAEPRSAKP
jgi:hypothetical protein